MPIDPSLITDVMSRWQGPPPADPLAQFGKLQALRSGVLQQQAAAQNLQTGAVELQQRQEAMAQQKAIDDAFQGGMTRDADGSVSLTPAVLNSLAAAGHGSAIPGLTETFAKANKATLDLKEAKTKVATATDDYVASHLATIADSKYDPTLAQATIAKAAQDGVLPAPQAQQLSAQIQQNPTPDGVKALIDPLLSQSPAYQKLLDSRKTATGAAQRGEAAAAQADIAQTKLQDERDQKWKNAVAAAGSQDELDALRAQAKAQGISPAAIGGTPPVWSQQAMQQYGNSLLTPEQRATGTRADATAKALAGNRAAELAQGAQRLSVSRGELALRNQEYQQKYGDALGNMSPNNQAIAQKLAAGEFDPAQLGRIPGKEQIIAGAIQINPNWTPQTYATKRSFTDPEKTQSKNLGTISRIVGHIGRFEDNSKALGFAPAYAMGVNLTGPQNQLNEDAHAIAGELEKLVSGGVGSAGQVEAWKKSLSSPSADARQKAVDEISQLIGSQYEGMAQTYQAGTGQDLPVGKYVSPAGQKWMAAKGINVGAPGAQSGADAGAQPALPPAAAAQLRRGVNTTFGNGQVWTLDASGKPAQVK
jgi:hypothetical protein